MVTGSSGAWGKMKRTGFSRVSICRVFRAVIGPPDIRERPATLTFSASASPKILSNTLPKLSKLRRRWRIRCQKLQRLALFSHSLDNTCVGNSHIDRRAKQLRRLTQYLPVQVLATVDHGEKWPEFLVTQLFVFHKLP